MRESAPGADVTDVVRSRLPGRSALPVKILLSLVPPLTLLVGFTGWIEPVAWRQFHLLVVIPLVFLLYPAKAHTGRSVSKWDWSWALVAAVALSWVLIDRERLLWRMTYVDPILRVDLLMGTLAIAAVLEATRRTLGWTIVVVTLVFVTYAFVGPFLPGILQHKGVPFSLLIEHLYLVPEGVFNLIVGVMATYVMTFLLFGTLLRFAGGDQLFMDLTLKVARRTPGGAAKAAVIGSALVGSAAGSTIANILTTGAITIPLMKRSGFRPHESAAIETAASTGGAVMPPMMGAGVFVMSELTGIPLITILLYSIVPAFLYFASIYAYVHVKACRHGLQSLSEEVTTPAWRIVFRGGTLLLPLVALVYLLIQDYTPFLASSVTCLLALALSYLRAETRFSLPRLVEAFQTTTRSALALSATGASAGVIMGVITITGLMQKVTSILLGLAGGSLALGILLTAAISTFLGMGLPVTSAYIIVSALGAAALSHLGMDMLAAHLVLFWFSQSATITPPVCMTAFVAASIAKAAPMRTGFEALRVAKALYLMPFLFGYAHLLRPPVWRIILDALGALLGLCLIPTFLEGWCRRRLNLKERGFLAVAACCAFVSTFESDAGATGLWLLSSITIAVWGSRGPGRASQTCAVSSAAP